MKPNAAIIKRIRVCFRLRSVDRPQGTGLRRIRFGYLPKRPFSTARKTHMEQVLVWSEMKGEPCNRSIEGDSFFRARKGRACRSQRRGRIRRLFPLHFRTMDVTPPFGLHSL